MNAAAALMLTVADPEQRAELMYQFDERAGVCHYDGGMSRGEAERIAYRELAQAVVRKSRSVRKPNHDVPIDLVSATEVRERGVI